MLDDQALVGQLLVAQLERRADERAGRFGPCPGEGATHEAAHPAGLDQHEWGAVGVDRGDRHVGQVRGDRRLGQLGRRRGHRGHELERPGQVGVLVAHDGDLLVRFGDQVAGGGRWQQQVRQIADAPQLPRRVGADLVGGAHLRGDAERVGDRQPVEARQRGDRQAQRDEEPVGGDGQRGLDDEQAGGVAGRGVDPAGIERRVLDLPERQRRHPGDVQQRRGDVHRGARRRAGRPCRDRAAGERVPLQRTRRRAPVRSRWRCPRRPGR